jgi:phosphoribosyl 1,2-cyclic phosphodiesterase
MSLFITSLNSGSNGNCYYVGNSHEAVLIDAGISCRETEKRMKRLGLDMAAVKAIFVSHEHGDHITGIPALSKKYQLPVYATGLTCQHLGLPVEEHLLMSIKTNSSITIGQLQVTCFAKKHDAVEPCSFVVNFENINIGVFTDIGVACDDVVHHFKKCHAIFLEANYDTDMLMRGNYPYHLKKRISNGFGHLSNAQALELFLKHRPKYMSHVILSHLSKNNNSPELVQQLFDQHAGNTKIIVASRYNETPVYFIGEESSNHIIAVKKKQVKHEFQLSMF